MGEGLPEYRFTLTCICLSKVETQCIQFNPTIVQLPTTKAQIETYNNKRMSKYNESPMRSSQQHAKGYTPIFNCKTMFYTLYKQGKSYESTFHTSCGIYIYNFSRLANVWRPRIP